MWLIQERFEALSGSFRGFSGQLFTLDNSPSSRHSYVTRYLFASEETQHTNTVNDEESVNLLNHLLLYLNI